MELDPHPVFAHLCQGITDQRNEYKLSDTVQPGGTFEVYVEMACNGMFGTTDGIKPPAEDRYFKLKEVALAVPNMAVTQVRCNTVSTTMSATEYGWHARSQVTLARLRPCF